MWGVGMGWAAGGGASGVLWDRAWDALLLLLVALTQTRDGREPGGGRDRVGRCICQRRAFQSLG